LTPDRHPRIPSLQALEPNISTEIMTLHHDQHHRAYVENLNIAEKKLAETTDVLEKIALEAAIRFNGGGQSVSLCCTYRIITLAPTRQDTSTTPSSGEILLRLHLKTPNRRKTPISQTPFAPRLETLTDSRSS
jgi:hypothetical protein